MRRRSYLPLLLIAGPGIMALGIGAPAGAAGADNGVAGQTGAQIVTAAAGATSGATSFTYGGTTAAGRTDLQAAHVGQHVGERPGDHHHGRAADQAGQGREHRVLQVHQGILDQERGPSRGPADREPMALRSGDRHRLCRHRQSARCETGRRTSSPTRRAPRSPRARPARSTGSGVIAVTGKDTSGGGGGTVYVATTGKPYIVRITASGTSLHLHRLQQAGEPDRPGQLDRRQQAGRDDHDLHHRLSRVDHGRRVRAAQARTRSSPRPRETVEYRQRGYSRAH